MLVFHRSLACSWLGVVILAAVATAADTAEKGKHEPPPLIEEALEQYVDFEFVKAPLSDFAAYIQERYHVPVVLDRAALAKAEVPADATVTFTAKHMPLRSAITWALSPLAMDWVVLDDALLLSTRDVADETMSTLVHDVSDFIAPRGEKEEASAVKQRLAELAEVVQATVTPDTWQDADGDASIKPLDLGDARVLVVYHNRRGQEAVAMLLDDLAFYSEAPTQGSPRQPSGSHAKVTSLIRPAH